MVEYAGCAGGVKVGSIAELGFDCSELSPKVDGGLMTTRQRLANRRASVNFTFELDGLRYTATVSRTENGGLAELFLNNTKGGSQADTNARDAAIILSFALQYGADLDTIREALSRDVSGRAIGPVGAALDILAGR